MIALGYKAERAADLLFMFAKRRCSAQVEAIALSHITGPFPYGPITYLSACSVSPAALAKLERLAVPERLSTDKALAIQAIQNRIGKLP